MSYGAEKKLNTRLVQVSIKLLAITKFKENKMLLDKKHLFYKRTWHRDPVNCGLYIFMRLK